MEHSEWNVREAAVKALGKLEPAALAPHAATIVQRLEHSDERVRRAAVQVLGRLEPAALAPHAAALLKFDAAEKEEKVRILAMPAMVKLQPETRDERVAAVVQRLEHSRPFVREAAVEALGRLDPAVLSEEHAAALRRARGGA